MRDFWPGKKDFRNAKLSFCNSCSAHFVLPKIISSQEFRQNTIKRPKNTIQTDYV